MSFPAKVCIMVFIMGLALANIIWSRRIETQSERQTSFAVECADPSKGMKIEAKEGFILIKCY